MTSDELNAFFVNIGSKLANICEVKSLPRISRVLNSCFLRPADVNEIENIILALKNKKTYGHDGFSNEMIKLCSPVISPYLVQCFNTCIDEGVFQEFLKIAKVFPLHKSGSKKDANNYRPISLLTSFSKIFEKMIFNRMICFIEKFGLLAKQQNGFCKKRSCVHAIIKITDFMRNTVCKKCYFLAFYVDFKKAFDTVDHAILLDKLD